MADSDAAADAQDLDLKYPNLYLGQHDSSREEPLNDLQYGHMLNIGFAFATCPITNSHFQSRVTNLVHKHVELLQTAKVQADTTKTPCIPDPIVTTITPDDTGLFPVTSTKTSTAYSSPWIDLASPNPVIANISRQVLNLEITYATFCGVRTIIIPGPRKDSGAEDGIDGLTLYSRAIREALRIAPRLNFVIHLPMYREPQLDETASTLSEVAGIRSHSESDSVDLFSAWETWDHIRSVSDYNSRLLVGVRLPKRLPETELQTRWFSEPVYFLSAGNNAFQMNKGNYPCLSKEHQKLIFTFLTLKSPPSMMLCDVGPDVSNLAMGQETGARWSFAEAEFPVLGKDSKANTAKDGGAKTTDYIQYLKWLESQQPGQSQLEFHTLTSFQDWLQSPLQPLSDNLESATYEVFEADPVKYNQYEVATHEALVDWSRRGKPTSSSAGVVIAVAGSGRGPLVQRALVAAQTAGVDVEVWAVEKNPSAYAYLLRRNREDWNQKVNVVKSDMRNWPGPHRDKKEADGGGGSVVVEYGKVDILISELLGSFGDNELSPECLDGIQHVLSPQGISIPSSYTAHLAPIATPRLHADLLSRTPVDPHALDTPWVVRLFQVDFAAKPRVPGHDRFQEAWEFVHPVSADTARQMDQSRAGGFIGGVGGSMDGAVGANEHNARYCRLKFVCQHRGVIHGLAGYFESTLFETVHGKVEISTHPERIDQKSKDMISWFPIFFPLKAPLQYPDDTELEVSMWRQTDDKRVWYEWMVDVYTWTASDRRIKIGSSQLCSSRSVACIM